MTYSEQLKDPRWQQLRLRMFDVAGWKCQCEGCSDPNDRRQLHLHHKVYFRNTLIWDYPEWALQVLCFKCHAKVQTMMESGHTVIALNESLFLALSLLGKLPGGKVSEFCDDVLTRVLALVDKERS